MCFEHLLSTHPLRQGSKLKKPPDTSDSMPPSPAPRITEINLIANHGLYRNFAWDAGRLQPFDRYNLVYGWNYSGKTTLSRIFQAVEDGKLSPDFAGATFRLTLSEGTTIDSTFTPPLPPVKVFNRDFVSRNFHAVGDMTGATALAVVGEQNQKLKSRLGTLKRRLESVHACIDRLVESQRQVKSGLDDGATAQAKTINAIVGGGRFDRRHLLPIVQGLPEDSLSLIFEAERLEEVTEQWRRAGDFVTINYPENNLKPIFSILREFRKTLRRTASNTAIQALRENRKLEEWVGDGMSKNSAGAPCNFCGGVVTEERWKTLEQHFSDALLKLQKKLSALAECLGNFPENFEELPAYSYFAPGLEDRAASAVAEVRFNHFRLGQYIAAAKETLKQKRESIEVPIVWKHDKGLTKTYRAAINDLHRVIGEHNGQVYGAEEIKAKAKNSICRHYAAEYVRDSNFHVKSEEVKVLQKRINEGSALVTVIETKIGQVEEAIQAASIGPSLINDQLALLLPGDNITAVRVTDTDFEFRRNGIAARNMSDGERTAVAFAYFLGKLKEGAIPIEQMIIVIDDPISSLDSNHIYCVWAIIESRLTKAAQLFILTHNSQFFGMTRDWMKDRRRQNASRYYFVSRTLDQAGIWSSSLAPLPHLLKKFKSEYHFTYFCLKQIYDSPSPPLESLCGAGYMVRSLLESYLGFVFPGDGGLAEKLPLIISSEVVCGKVYKFANENAHSHSLAQATQVPDYLLHCKEVIGLVIDAIQQKTPEHILALDATLVVNAGP